MHGGWFATMCAKISAGFVDIDFTELPINSLQRGII